MKVIVWFILFVQYVNKSLDSFRAGLKDLVKLNTLTNQELDNSLVICSALQMLPKGKAFFFTQKIFFLK